MQKQDRNSQQTGLEQLAVESWDCTERGRQPVTPMGSIRDDYSLESGIPLALVALEGETPGVAVVLLPPLLASAETPTTKLK